MTIVDLNETFQPFGDFESVHTLSFVILNARHAEEFLYFSKDSTEEK